MERSRQRNKKSVGKEIMLFHKNQVRKSSKKYLVLCLFSLLQATLGCLPINEFTLNQDVTVTDREIYIDESRY